MTSAVTVFTRSSSGKLWLIMGTYGFSTAFFTEGIWSVLTPYGLEGLGVLLSVSLGTAPRHRANFDKLYYVEVFLSRPIKMLHLKFDQMGHAAPAVSMKTNFPLGYLASLLIRPSTSGVTNAAPGVRWLDFIPIDGSNRRLRHTVVNIEPTTFIPDVENENRLTTGGATISN